MGQKYIRLAHYFPRARTVSSGADPLTRLPPCHARCLLSRWRTGPTLQPTNSIACPLPFWSLVTARWARSSLLLPQTNGPRGSTSVGIAPGCWAATYPLPVYLCDSSLPHLRGSLTKPPGYRVVRVGETQGAIAVSWEEGSRRLGSSPPWSTEPRLVIQGDRPMSGSVFKVAELREGAQHRRNCSSPFLAVVPCVGCRHRRSAARNANRWSIVGGGRCPLHSGSGIGVVPVRIARRNQSSTADPQLVVTRGTGIFIPGMVIPMSFPSVPAPRCTTWIGTLTRGHWLAHHRWGASSCGLSAPPWLDAWW
jgi:hypothetical protein